MGTSTIHLRSIKSSLPSLYPLRHSRDKIFQALYRFSVLQAAKSWAGPGNEATSALLHPSSLVRTIFTDSSRTCNSNFIGYNCLYGASHCKSYSPNHIAIGNLVREIRSTHTFIPHFSHNELEAIVSAVVL